MPGGDTALDQSRASRQFCSPPLDTDPQPRIFPAGERGCFPVMSCKPGSVNRLSGSGEPNKKKVAKITKAQVQEIAELKMPDLNAASLESAMSMIAGTARSMGVEVTE